MADSTRTRVPSCTISGELSTLDTVWRDTSATRGDVVDRRQLRHRSSSSVSSSLLIDQTRMSYEKSLIVSNSIGVRLQSRDSPGCQTSAVRIWNQVEKADHGGMHRRHYSRCSTSETVVLQSADAGVVGADGSIGRQPIHGVYHSTCRLASLDAVDHGRRRDASSTSRPSHPRRRRHLRLAARAARRRPSPIPTCAQSITRRTPTRAAMESRSRSRRDCGTRSRPTCAWPSAADATGMDGVKSGDRSTTARSRRHPRRRDGDVGAHDVGARER